MKLPSNKKLFTAFLYLLCIYFQFVAVTWFFNQTSNIFLVCGAFALFIAFANIRLFIQFIRRIFSEENNSTTAP